MHRWRIHWAWVPAAIVFIAIAWQRYGLLPALGLVGSGLALGAYLEWRARRRPR